MIIFTDNPETTDLEKTFLASPIAAGVTTFEVKNNDRIAQNYRIMVGEMGQEKTEVVTVSSVSGGTTLVTGATVFEHSANDPVYVLRFDQVKIYRSTTTSTGSYSILTTVNLDVDNADLTTLYDDTTGLSTYYYKTSLYHSVSTLESALSDPIPGGGFSRNQVGNIIDEILKEVADPQEQNISRNEILGYFNDVNDDLTINVAKPYDFLHSRTVLTRTANRNYLAFPTDSNGLPTMWKFDYMNYNFTDTTVTPNVDNTDTIEVMPIEEFQNKYPNNVIDSTTVSDDKPLAMALDTAVDRFRFSHPAETTTSNVFYLYYWKYFDTIDSEGDSIETPTPKIYKLYVKAMYYNKRSLSDVNMVGLATKYEQQYEREKIRYKQVDRKDAGTPRSFRPPSTTSRSFRSS